jgi:hypothetical protein
LRTLIKQVLGSSLKVASHCPVQPPPEGSETRAGAHVRTDDVMDELWELIVEREEQEYGQS